MIYFGSLVRDPKDIRVFGRAIGMAHKPGRDDATEADVARRSWKERYRRYVRVHDAEFVSGSLENGVSLNEMMDALRADAFASTQRNLTAPEQAIQTLEEHTDSRPMSCYQGKVCAGCLNGSKGAFARSRQGLARDARRAGLAKSVSNPLKDRTGTIVIERGPRSYGRSCPDLRGCVAVANCAHSPCRNRGLDSHSVHHICPMGIAPGNRKGTSRL